MKKPLLVVLLSTTLVAAAAPRASAQVDKLKISDAVKELRFGGDLRLRDDLEKKRGPNLNNRGRLRWRLRFGFEADLPEEVTAIVRLGSGTGEQVSTNQSYDNLSSQKAIWIDLANLRWKPKLSEDGNVTLTGGRMINPLWRTYSSDLVWDEDFNPEGFGESVEWLVPDAGLSLFANGVQAVADEDSTSGKNQWFFSQQVGVEKTLPMDSRLRVAAAYHKWSDENRSTFGQTLVQDGNRRSAGGVLLNKFGVGEVTAQLTTWAGKVPLNFQGTAIRNFSAVIDGIGVVNGTAVTGPRARDGYQFGTIIGAAKAKGSWEAAYFKKYLQSDATVADVADSDMGDGGTNIQGHIVWVAYAPRDWLLLKARALFTDTIDRNLVPGDKAVNRLFLDAVVKF